MSEVVEGHCNSGAIPVGRESVGDIEDPQRLRRQGGGGGRGQPHHVIMEERENRFHMSNFLLKSDFGQNLPGFET